MIRNASSSVELVPDVQSFMRLLSVCMRVRGLCREGSECRETWQEEARKDADEWQKCARCQAKSYEIWATATRNTFFLLNFSHVVASSRQALCFATLHTSWLCALLLSKNSAFTQFFFSSLLSVMLCWCWSENFHHSEDEDSDTNTHIHTIATTWRLIKVHL